MNFRSQITFSNVSAMEERENENHFSNCNIQMKAKKRAIYTQSNINFLEKHFSHSIVFLNPLVWRLFVSCMFTIWFWQMK